MTGSPDDGRITPEERGDSTDTESRQAQSGAALVVEAVDRRLTAVSQLGWDDPRVLDEYGTVVLSARPEPYGLGDLIARGAVRQDDASTFTLERSVVVRAGARLQIDAPGATLRLRSDEAGFADLVGWGGSIALNGADGAPLTVTSWDGTHSSADILTHDGRAFVLVRNGRFETAHTSFNKLGFWSGRTGGVAVVSTDIGLATAALTATAHTGLAYGVFLSGVVDSTVTGLTVPGAALTASRDIPARNSGAVSDAVLARSTLIGSETAASTTDARIAITENTFAVREGTPLTLGGRAHGVVERNTFNGTGQDPIGVADTARGGRRERADRLAVPARVRPLVEPASDGLAVAAGADRPRRRCAVRVRAAEAPGRAASPARRRHHPLRPREDRRLRRDG